MRDFNESRRFLIQIMNYILHKLGFGKYLMVLFVHISETIVKVAFFAMVKSVINKGIDKLVYVVIISVKFDELLNDRHQKIACACKQIAIYAILFSFE